MSLFILIWELSGLLYVLKAGGVQAWDMVKPLVDEAITTTFVGPGASDAFYRAALPLSRATLTYLSGVIRRRPAKIGVVLAQDSEQAHRVETAASEGRARLVPDRVVDRELPRPLPDNAASVATWLDAGEPSSGGDLTRKRSDPGMAR
jgi:hypothetical protein